jgi:ribosomal protein L37AE/L43A
MPQENPPIQCPICQSGIRHVPSGISKKTGKPYNEFWSCRNMDCNFTWRGAKSAPKTTGSQVMMEEIQNINKRLDELGKYLKEKLEK